MSSESAAAGDREVSAPRWHVWFVSLIAFALVTAIMVATRSRLGSTHISIAYLLIVQLASARGGRPLGIVLAVTSFLAFNWFFLPPYGTFTVADPLDWIVLVAFLVTGIVSAELLYRAEELGAERARRTAALSRAATLEESSRSKDAMLASVSHDLRTPLTTIKGLAHEIAATGDERAEIIEEETDRLDLFVGKLLDYSRVTLGAAALDVQANEAEDVLGAAAQQVQGRLDGRPLVIHVEPSGELLFGRFDFVQTLRVLVNLLDNAVRHSPAGSSIDLGARRRGAMLELWVADRGPGIPASERDKIFEPFYSRGRGGTGLGLSIARGIAEAQGGAIRVESRDGGGSVFTLSVPAIDLDATALGEAGSVA